MANVVRPTQKTHQPHLPADLGSRPESPGDRGGAADLARTYVITGLLLPLVQWPATLNRPFDEVLSTGRPEFPFCLCWANEN
jgi:hypothetical protein